MKVLLVHNDYGKYSGEEAVVDKMAYMLHDDGCEVAQLRMSTAGSRENIIGKIRGFVNGIYCPSGIKAMSDAIKRERPDVINVHNLYPFISPAALRMCKAAGVPVVMTVHNFRLICPTGLFMRDNKPCELCLEKGNEWSCVKYNCENSILKSIGYTVRNYIARTHRHYIDCVDRFACITDFQRRKLIEANFPKEKLIVIPNSMDVAEKTISNRGKYVAFCGRLSREKGVDMIIKVARRHPEILFKFAGAIRDMDLIQKLPVNVELTGYLEGESLDNFYSNARFFVMASRWYEGFPMTILEAAKFGKAMIAPDHGGFSEIIGKDDDAIGRLFTPSKVDELEDQIIDLWNNSHECERLGNAALTKLKRSYSTDVIKRQWMDLFKSLTATATC